MTTKPTTGQAVHGGGQPINPGQAVNPPGQPMNAPGVPPYPRGPAPSTVGSRFKRFLFNVFLVILAFAAGYVYMERESQRDREAMEREQMAATERIAALERRIEELGRQSGTRVELDLTEVFEPIREALSQVTLVTLSEISDQITKELVRVVETDLAVDLAGVGAAASESGAEVAELTSEEPSPGADDAAASEPGAAEDAVERAEAPAAEPSTQRPPEPGDDGGELASTGPAAQEAPATGPDVSWNAPLAPVAIEPEPQPAPVSDVVLLLAQYTGPSADPDAPVAQ